ncbi:MAG: TIGR03435 family protein [Acidobacteriaceae bacterium]
MDMSAPRNSKASRLFTLPLLALIAIAATAQQPAPATPPSTPLFYDIVSIHPHRTLDDNVSVDTRPGNFSGTNTSLKELISYAYGIRADLISGLPGWANTARFDVTAKVSDFDNAVFKNMTTEQREAMFRPMLADRFHLKVHAEIKNLEVFNLVVTKDGPKFKPNPPANLDPNSPKQPDRDGIWINNDDMVATAIPISELANVLAQQLHHTVIDKTGLAGNFDLKLKWTPDELQNTGADDGTTNAPPGLFTALQEQLGLKLEASKGPVKTLVVDHADQPTPN